MPAQDDLFGPAPTDTQAAVDHRCLGCGQAHADAREVHLVDGTLVSSYSEAWRIECEARAALNMRPLHRRQEFLAKIGDKRGKAAMDQLKAVMLAIWNARQAEKSAA